MQLWYNGIVTGVLLIICTILIIYRSLNEEMQATFASRADQKYFRSIFFNCQGGKINQTFKKVVHLSWGSLILIHSYQ